MKPGTRLNPLSSVGHWEGVLRDGSGRVVWACGHLHKCRDQNSRIHGKAARRCAEEALRLGEGHAEDAAGQHVSHAPGRA